MTRIPIYQIDAFSDRVFGGNPAAICPLDEWLPDAVMQSIAAENNLSETAFFVPDGDGYHLRWFTPTVEVDLCGHATLASAYLVLTRLKPKTKAVRFTTRSGDLEVARRDDLLVMDFPALPAEAIAAPNDLVAGLGVTPEALLRATNYLAIFGTEADVARLEPDMERLAELYPYGVIATAPGETADFVSRYFAPAHGVPEDPVTGSAHCTLIPYWSQRLDKRTLDARQISGRGGALLCEDRGERVSIGGRAVLYLEGTISI